MSVKKFKFVSPGIFLSEVDNSQLPAIKQAVGPIVIGRTRFGPAMRPVSIESPSDFVQTFGTPIAGGGSGGDVWRNGNLTGPTYASYAAMAYLKAGVGPVTVMRLLGEENRDATGTGDSVAFAGWKCAKIFDSQTMEDSGGSYGLFIFPSGTVASATGTLGAILYCNNGGLALTGTAISSTAGGVAHEGACAVFESEAKKAQFKLSVYGPTDTSPAYKASFNFDRDDDLFIRNVLNTNPQMTNTAFVSSDNLKKGERHYWLGETFEQDVEEIAGGLDQNTRAVLLPLMSGTIQKDNYKINNQAAKTGYFFSQDLAADPSSYSYADMTKLFRVVAQDAGRWAQDNLKISLESIRASSNTTDPYGSFSLVVRAANDRDNVVQVIERFSNVNLNPLSENYVARVIGDTSYEFDYNQKTLRSYGEYPNKSKYIRIEMNPDVGTGLTDARLLPFGCTGPIRFKPFSIVSGSALSASTATAFARGTGSAPLSTPPYPWSPSQGDRVWMGVATPVVGSTPILTNIKLNFPIELLRHSASDGGLSDPTDAFFGVQNTQGANSSRTDRGYGDYMWRRPEGITAEDSLAGLPDALPVEYSWTVTLDDIVTADSPSAYWSGSSYAANTSLNAVSSSYTAILDAGYDRITAPLYGGFDGFNIKEADPIRNGLMTSAGTTDTTNYAYNTIKRAIDTVADPDYVECNVITAPGVTNASLTQHLMDVCEDRGDALAIIDLPEVYTPFTDSTDTFKERNSFTVAEAVSDLRTRGVNSSYGCTYYPWVQILDNISSNVLWVPPSVVALGTMASSEAKSEVWFAPAGFNRGGLTDGSAGWPVLNVTKRLTSRDRDTLYEANINPIASFPSEGIVVFGQKTLQVTRSALDRINVRRLLIYIKKQVSRIASGILFDQNVQVTWNSILG